MINDSNKRISQLKTKLRLRKDKWIAYLLEPNFPCIGVGETAEEAEENCVVLAMFFISGLLRTYEQLEIEREDVE